MPGPKTAIKCSKNYTTSFIATDTVFSWGIAKQLHYCAHSDSISTVYSRPGMKSDHIQDFSSRKQNAPRFENIFQIEFNIL